MPYAIEYQSKITDEIRTGPALRKRVEKKLVPVTFKYMTKKEAEEYCEDVNDDPTFKNAEHMVVRV